jgi:predicted regulator of Ras-like GTPase activity (Roadblock/LC7/MglB family)
MEKDLILKKNDLHRLNVILTKVIDTARIDCALIINKSGRMITSQSETSEYNKTSLAALVSGNFASSSSIANLLGEDEFSSMLQEGKEKHIFVSILDEQSIFTCIFDKRTTLAKIKTCLTKQSPKLIETLKVIYSNVALDPELNLDV